MILGPGTCNLHLSNIHEGDDQKIRGYGATMDPRHIPVNLHQKPNKRDYENVAKWPGKWMLYILKTNDPWRQSAGK